MNPRARPHPNRLPFEGVLTRVDQPSDKAPAGARGHRVLLTKVAAEESLHTLLGMGVAFKNGWGGHDARQKCGVIDRAEVVGDELRVWGYLYAHDFPEVPTAIRNLDMGMSYELMDITVLDLRAEVWTLTRSTFTGAAILLRLKAAYTTSRIHIVAEPLA